MERFTLFVSQVVAFLYSDRAICSDFTERYDRVANIYVLILSFVFDSCWQL